MNNHPQCPRCSAQLKDDYGMVACPSCNLLVFVDMDGIAQISNEEPALVSLPTDEGIVEESAMDPAEYINEPQFSNQSDELSSEAESTIAPFAVEPIIEPTLLEDNGDELAGELDMDALLGVVEPQYEQPVEPEFGTPGDPLGLNEYANSELSQAKDGLLTFKILISGIDSKEMRESLRSALDDQRFGWNPNDLIARISKGVLQIDNVASVKAVILINRIKRMQVKVRWEQYAITKMETN